jgi:hypothetical protein
MEELNQRDPLSLSWRRKSPTYIAIAIFLFLLVVSVVSGYFIVDAMNDYDEPDVPEQSQGAGAS